MRMLTLAVRDLLVFMRSKKLLFTLLLLGFIAALYSILYTMTIALDDILSAKEQINYDRKVTMEYLNNLPNSKDAHSLITMLEEWGWENYTIFHRADSDKAVDGDVIVAACNIIPGEFLKEYFGFKEGKFLSYEDIHSNTLVCVVTQSLVDYTQKSSWLEQIFPVDDMELNIKGVHFSQIYSIPDVYEKMDIDQVVVPAGLLRETKLPIVYWEIIANAPPTPEQLQVIQDWVDNYTPDAVVEWPISMIASNSWRSFLIRVAYQFIIMGLALVNMIAILVSWVYSNRRQWYAFYICGAGKGRLLVLVLLETTLMSLVAAIPVSVAYLASDIILTWGNISYRLLLPQGIITYLALMMVATGVVLVRSTPIIRRIVQERGR